MRVSPPRQAVAPILSVLTLCSLGCSSPSASSPAHACTTGFLGSESQPPKIEILVVQPDDSVTTPVDGGPVPLVQPPQGGRVVFAGARVTNMDGCGLELTGALRDETSRQVRVDMRTVNLISTGDGWGATRHRRSVGAPSRASRTSRCAPTEWSSTDVNGRPYQLEVDVTDREGRSAKAVLEVTPFCSEPESAAYCACTCSGELQRAAVPRGRRRMKLGAALPWPRCRSLPAAARQPRRRRRRGRSRSRARRRRSSRYGERRPRTCSRPEGPSATGSPSTMLHFDGSAWRGHGPRAGLETFWWVHGTGASDVWAVGEQGRIVHYDGSALADARRPAPRRRPSTACGRPPSRDVWAVGGSIDHGRSSSPTTSASTTTASTWSATDGPPAMGRVFFKVWGTRLDEPLRRRRAGVDLASARAPRGRSSPNSTLAKGNLLTVSGCSATEVYAVGNADVLRSDGATWTRASADDVNDGVNGVACAKPGAPVIVGNAGTKERLVDGQWQDDFASDPHQDIHGAWADPSGGYWAAGGDFASPARDGGVRAGFVARYGP